MATAMSFGHRLEELTDGVTVFQGGIRKPMPLTATTIEIEIAAGLAIAVITRTFANTEDVPIEAILTMPVSFNAVVTSLSATIDGRKLRAIVREKSAAREEYEASIDEGKMAVLHEEALRGIHILSVGQLPPSKRVEVELRMVLPLATSADGPFLRLPMTAGQLYGNTPLQPADDLITDKSVHHFAKLRIQTTSGRAILGGTGPIEIGAQIDILLDKSVEVLLPDTQFGTILGASARGKQVRLELRPVPVNKAALNLAVLIDRSGSTSQHVGHGQQTVLSAMRAGLADAFTALKDEDRIALWQFGSECDHLGTSSGSKAGQLLARLGHPNGGTNLKEAIREVAAGGVQDVLVLTDGQTWDALPPLSAELNIRISAILVGKASLDVNIGHLCAMTGGDLFYAPQADVTSAARIALNSLRTPHHTPQIEVSAGQPMMVLRRYGAVEIVATWENGAQKADDSDYGKFAAALCIGLLDEIQTKVIALQEGLCTHLTSLVLTDDVDEASFGISETRKVPLMAERGAIRAMQSFSAGDSGVRFLMREKLCPEMEQLKQQRLTEWRRPKKPEEMLREQKHRAIRDATSKIWCGNIFIALLEQDPELIKWKDKNRKEINEYLELAASNINWATQGNRFLVGDVSSLTIIEEAMLLALQRHDGILTAIKEAQIDPTILLLAWIAVRFAPESKSAQRFAKRLLRETNSSDLFERIDYYVFEAPRLTELRE